MHCSGLVQRFFTLCFVAEACYLEVTGDGHGLVRLFEVLDLLPREIYVQAPCACHVSMSISQSPPRLTQDVLQVVETGRAHDGRGNMRLRQDPRDSDLCHADPLLLRKLLHPEGERTSASTSTPAPNSVALTERRCPP